MFHLFAIPFLGQKIHHLHNQKLNRFFSSYTYCSLFWVLLPLLKEILVYLFYHVLLTVWTTISSIYLKDLMTMMTLMMIYLNQLTHERIFFVLFLLQLLFLLIYKMILVFWFYFLCSKTLSNKNLSSIWIQSKQISRNQG